MEARPAPRVGIIGTGSIGVTLLRAAARFAPEVSLACAGRSLDRCRALAGEIPGLVALTPRDLSASVDLLLLAIPPGAYAAQLAEVRDVLAPEAVVVSLSNGITLEAVGEAADRPVVKVVPTMAHRVGRGVCVVVAGPRAREEHLARVEEFFSTFARPVRVEERDCRIASNVAGSFLALAASFLDEFVAANAARPTSLDRAALTEIAAETFGAVADLVASGVSPGEIVEGTATPGGTSRAALDVLQGELPAIARGMIEAVERRQAEMLDRAGRLVDSA